MEESMRNQFVVFAAAMLLAACAASQQQSQPTSTSAPTVPTPIIGGESLPVGSIPSATLHDTQRNKDLSMAIEYPTRGGPYPVIVFSHGYGSNSEGYIGLTEYWVGRGYVVIKPSHADAGALKKIIAARRGQRREEIEKARAAGTISKRQADKQVSEIRVDDDLGESIWANQTPADWENRVRDIRLILDSFGTLQQKYPELQGKMDTSRLGVAGHSYGAFTTMLLTGATTSKLSGSFADPRIKAAIAMSPQGVGDPYALTPESWTNVKLPIMYMTGSLDRGIVNHDDPSWRHDPFQYSPAGDKYFISFEGARHITFAGGLGMFEEIQMTGPSYTPIQTTDQFGNPRVYEQRNPSREKGESALLRERNIFSAIKSTSVAFWDAYLKGDAKAKDRVSGDWLKDMNGGKVTVERK
jgi:predicted dienelactone hydrolase